MTKPHLLLSSMLKLLFVYFITSTTLTAAQKNITVAGTGLTGLWTAKQDALSYFRSLS